MCWSMDGSIPICSNSFNLWGTSCIAWSHLLHSWSWNGPGFFWSLWGSNSFTKTHQKQVTLLETNIAPETGWLWDYFPFGRAHFQGYVSLREGNWWRLTFVPSFQCGLCYLVGWCSMIPKDRGENAKYLKPPPSCLLPCLEVGKHKN